MKLQQLSIFVENKPGRLATACKPLADAGINILTLSLADTQQFGILRVIVRDWQKALGVLESAGCVVKVTEVLAIEVPDRPGGLAETLQAIGRAGVNVEYMYAFTFKRQNRGVMVFRFDDADKACQVLAGTGVNIVAGEEICDLLEKK